MVATAAGLFMLVGMLGLAVDLGRVFIVKSEGQAFADIAAMAAARKLDGKSTGITAAQNEVANSTNKWLFGTQSFAAGIRTVEFATKTSGSSGSTACTSGTWTTAPTSPYTNYGCVRVTVTPAVNLSFMPVLGTGYTQTVTSQAVAGVVPETFPLGGYMPFTPFSHMPNCSVTITTGCDATGNYGMYIGQEYAFHWPSNVNQGNACLGDRFGLGGTNIWSLYNFSDQVPGSTRGYFTLQAASAISDAILGAIQTQPLSVGDTLTMTNGSKQAMADALNTRTSYDTDQTNYVAVTPSVPPGVAPAYYGNNMREVVMPVNSGPSTSAGFPTPYTVEGFASFLLYTNYTVGGGNKPWCAIYMGSTTDGGSGGVFGLAGAYVVRLTQ
jgi:Flp pilus assembly protein TadG